MALFLFSVRNHSVITVVHSYIEVYEVSSYDGFRYMPNYPGAPELGNAPFQINYTSILWDGTRRSSVPSLKSLAIPVLEI